MATEMLPSKVLSEAHKIILERWNPQGDEDCTGGKRCALGAVAEVKGLESWVDAQRTPEAGYLDIIVQGQLAADAPDPHEYEFDWTNVVDFNDADGTSVADVSDLFLDAIDDAKADEADARKQILALI